MWHATREMDWMVWKPVCVVQMRDFVGGEAGERKECGGIWAILYCGSAAVQAEGTVVESSARVLCD